jgi:biotin transport system substrate-specific component
LSHTTSVTKRPAVLADALPGAWARDIALVIAAALFTALLAQISIRVPGSPVPVTGQTLAVVIAGASLGAYRGGAALSLYALLGLYLPFYADGESGVDVITGATGGYIVGFIVAAFLIGKLAEAGADRKLHLAFLAFCLGQLAVFGIGVPWLKVVADMSWGDAIHNGFALFIVGGLIKAALAGALTPLAWRAVKRADAAE